MKLCYKNSEENIDGKNVLRFNLKFLKSTDKKWNWKYDVVFRLFAETKRAWWKWNYTIDYYNFESIISLILKQDSKLKQFRNWTYAIAVFNEYTDFCREGDRTLKR